MTTDAAKRPRKGHPLQFDTQPDPAPCQPGADTALKFTVEAFYGGKRVFDFQDLMTAGFSAGIRGRPQARRGHRGNGQNDDNSRSVPECSS